MALTSCPPSSSDDDEDDDDDDDVSKTRAFALRFLTILAQPSVVQVHSNWSWPTVRGLDRMFFFKTGHLAPGCQRMRFFLSFLFFFAHCYKNQQKHHFYAYYAPPTCAGSS
jgi:hypothetical protein